MNLGEFEHIVLLAILRVGEDAYAIPIREEIEERTGRAVARGALYTALERLETKRCLRSRMSDPLPERGGRSRRYFTVTPAGLAAIRSSDAIPPLAARSSPQSDGQKKGPCPKARPEFGRKRHQACVGERPTHLQDAMLHRTSASEKTLPEAFSVAPNNQA